MKTYIHESTEDVVGMAMATDENFDLDIELTDEEIDQLQSEVEDGDEDLLDDQFNGDELNFLDTEVDDEIDVENNMLIDDIGEMIDIIDGMN